ncbi:hypothetical protein [Deinococcus cellulosilyticus]|uniref:Uncharacterized protein n=1 Tax=Deinococcus cellulosilyticus (strain DSM 18568 / NBRC 106333 / KACC 11606 / 5516J-15) TaxID=1223518 RepID=A0A511MYV4_DEIC1|nr:hypothetical protein [Deinococcus cellulosilyticus]GEM45327.1 hypothetical protein DC3_09620 [Deinococcus cellulosilyticus NBRC 106333 = KACC 11606]
MDHLDRDQTLLQLKQAEQQGTIYEAANDLKGLEELQQTVLQLRKPYLDDAEIRPVSITLLINLMAKTARVRDRQGI